MTVRELILLLEKHDPEMPVLLLRPDYDSGTYTDLEGFMEMVGKRYPDGRHWDVWCKTADAEVVKVLVMD